MNRRASNLGTSVEETCQPPCPLQAAVCWLDIISCPPGPVSKIHPMVQQRRSCNVLNASRVCPRTTDPTLQTHVLPEMNFPPSPLTSQLSPLSVSPRAQLFHPPTATPAMQFARTCFWSLCRPFSFCLRRRAARSHCWAKCRILFFMKLRDSLPVPIRSRR